MWVKMRRINKIIVLSIILIIISISVSVQAGHNRPPIFIECPETIMVGSHCDIFTTTVKAKSRVLFPDIRYGAIRYKLLSGPGEVDAKTGEWIYEPTIEDSGDTQTVVIAAVQGELITVGSDACRFNVVVENNAPVLDYHYHNCDDTLFTPAPGSYTKRDYIARLEKIEIRTDIVEAMR